MDSQRFRTLEVAGHGTLDHLVESIQTPSVSPVES
jgi:hypothetical protein